MTEAEIIRTIKKKGYKITAQRRAIIEALAALDGPPTAKDVYEIVRERQPDVSLDTVYRNLNLLAETGCVVKINLKNSEKSRFEILENHHHHHLVCLGCGATVCLEKCLLDMHTEVLKDKGYKIVGHAFEIYGYCPSCFNSGEK